MKILGVDVSKWQGEIDWSKVKNDGVEFVMTRGGYGKNGYDVNFEKNYAGAKAACIPVGVYHYSYALSVESAKKEAEFCLSYLNGKQLEYPIAFDIEDPSQSSLDSALLTEIVLTFCDTVEKAGYYVCLYSNKYWLTSKLDMKSLARFDTWLAQWNDVVTYNGSYGIWQYSSNGKIAGISGNVDLNYAYKNYPEIIKKNNLNGFKNETHPEIPGENKYAKGRAVALKDIALYVSSTAKDPATTKSGILYIYDGIEVNGRYRITTTPANCGKNPMSEYVTGWIDKDVI